MNIDEAIIILKSCISDNGEMGTPNGGITAPEELKQAAFKLGICALRLQDYYERCYTFIVRDFRKILKRREVGNYKRMALKVDNEYIGRICDVEVQNADSDPLTLNIKTVKGFEKIDV